MDNDNDIVCLQELKSHFKNFSPDIIEEFYYTNERNISITIDSLIAYEKFGNIKTNKKHKKKKKKYKKEDLTHLANFEVVNNNENLDDNNINNNENISTNVFKTDYDNKKFINNFNESLDDCIDKNNIKNLSVINDECCGNFKNFNKNNYQNFNSNYNVNNLINNSNMNDISNLNSNMNSLNGNNYNNINNMNDFNNNMNYVNSNFNSNIKNLGNFNNNMNGINNFNNNFNSNINNMNNFNNNMNNFNNNINFYNNNSINNLNENMNNYNNYNDNNFFNYINTNYMNNSNNSFNNMNNCNLNNNINCYNNTTNNNMNNNLIPNNQYNNLTNMNNNNLNHINFNNKYTGNFNNNLINNNNIYNQNCKNDFNDYNNSNDNNNLNKKEDVQIEKMLFDLFPNYDSDEIIQKLVDFNFDVDAVVLSILEEIEKQESNKKENNNILEEDFMTVRKNKKKDFIKALDNAQKERKINNFNFIKNKVEQFVDKNINNKTIDLHGFTLSESIYILKKIITNYKEKIIYDNLPNINLTIITGRGLHSPGHIAVLHPNLAKWLKSLDKIKVDEKSDPGVIYVTIYGI